jgi:LacI family transcriptional regulator
MNTPRKVAVILDTNHPYQRKVIQGIAAYARQAGEWQLYVEEDPLDKLPDLRSWHGDGIITAFTERRFATLVHGIDTPVVGVEGGYGWYEPDSGIPYVTTDDGAVARMAADHLRGLGFSRLAYCGLPKNRHTAWSARRAEAFRARALEAGASVRIYSGRHVSTRQWTALQQDLCRWISSLDKPVGIMAGNDARARHVLEACRTVGARVPEEVAVIGVDNNELLCDLTDPPLTSIEQGARAIGLQAAELLQRLMDGRKSPRLATLVPPERVVVRGSTDVLAIGDADVAAAVRFIRTHGCEHIRVADVLAAVAVSRSTLEARFRAILGRTIHDEIQQTMLARARQLIVEEDLTLKEVASKAGFAHVQHLSNCFRRQFGCTPGEFRRTASGR